MTKIITKILILISILFVFTSKINTSELDCKQFKLYDIQYNSDFDYECVKKFNDFSELDRLDSVFITVPGKFTVMRFIFHNSLEDKYNIGKIMSTIKKHWIIVITSYNI